MLDRFNGDVLPFGSSATGTERTIFGDVTQSDDINANINADYFRGWGIIGVNDVPTKQDFNAMAYTNSYLTSYLYQQGIPTWNTNQKYYLYSRCIGSDGKQYKALTGTLATPNVENDPVGDSINWEEDSSELDINSLTNKTTPVNTDNLVIQETSGLLKKLSWSNLKATLKTYFDTLYGASLSTDNFLHIQDQKPSGTNGGSSVAGDQTRALNTILTNSIVGASLLSNQITLPAGDYYIEANSVSYAVNESNLYLYNVTDSLAIANTRAINNYSSNETTENKISGIKISLNATKQIDLRIYCEISRAGNGLGKAQSRDYEVYSDIKIWKVG